MHLRDFCQGYGQALACNVSCRNKESMRRYLEGKVNPADMSADELYGVVNDILVPLTRSQDATLAKESREQIEYFGRIIAAKKSPAA